MGKMDFTLPKRSSRQTITIKHKYHIGIVCGKCCLKMNENDYQEICFISAGINNLSYFISDNRSDLGYGQLVLFELDGENMCQIIECIAIEKDMLLDGVSYGSDDTLGRSMTKEWVEKISSHSPTLFSYETEKDYKRYLIYYSIKEANGKTTHKIQELYHYEKCIECIYHYFRIEHLESENKTLCRNNVYRDEECLSLLQEKIDDITKYVNSLDLDSIISNYHIYVRNTRVTKIGGDDRITIYREAESEVTDAYLCRLLPDYYEVLCEDRGYSNLYRDYYDEIMDWEKEAYSIEQKYKEEFYKFYNKHHHISTLLNGYIEVEFKKSYAPLFRKNENKIAINASEKWIEDNYHVNGYGYYTHDIPKFTKEEEIISWINNYNKIEESFYGYRDRIVRW